MPNKCAKSLGSRDLRSPPDADGWTKDLELLINRELKPVLQELRGAYNLAVGPTSTVTSDTTVTEETQYYLVDASGGAVTITLPSADKWKMPIFIKALDVSGGNITVATDGSDTIDDASSLTIYTQYDCYLLVSDETTGWWVV